MTIIKRNRNGQAIMELAIFGTIALAALAFLLKIGIRMNHDQEIRMAAFRRALAAARADNNTDQDAMGTTFYYVSNRQLPDATDSFMAPSRQRSEASAFVEWGDRLTFAHELNENGDDTFGYRTQPLIVVRSDGAEREFRQDDFPDDIPLGGGGPIDVILVATPGIVQDAVTTSNTSGTITSSGGGSSLSSGSSTTSTTNLLTKAGDSITSSVGSGTGVSW